MARIETTLNSEIKRRVQMNKSMQVVIIVPYLICWDLIRWGLFIFQWCEDQLAVLQERLEAQMQLRMTEIQEQIDRIVDRLTTLEEQFEYERERIPREIEERGAVLTKMLTDFQDMFEKERLSRLEREAAIMKRLTEHEHEVMQTFQNERVRFLGVVLAVLQMYIFVEHTGSEAHASEDSFRG